jgi:DNA mismatch repair protein MSH6
LSKISKKVVFLYKLRDGVCPESYGMNVARMAQIPLSIIDTAERVALEFERTHQVKTEDSCVNLNQIALFHSLYKEESIKRIWASLQPSFT